MLVLIDLLVLLKIKPKIHFLLGKVFFRILYQIEIKFNFIEENKIIYHYIYYLINLDKNQKLLLNLNNI